MRAVIVAACLVSTLLPGVAPADDQNLSPVWRRLEPLPDLGLSALTFDGRRFVAAGTGGIAVSDDGVLWSRHPADLGAFTFAMASNGDGLAAVGLEFAASSPDGAGWTREDFEQIELVDVTWVGDRWVAVGSAWHWYPPLNWPVVATQVPGEPWQLHWPEAPGQPSAVAWNGSMLVAVGSNGTVLTSGDGRAWVLEALPSDLGTLSLSDVVWTGDHWLAVGSPFVLTSQDGHAWTAVTGPDLMLWELAQTERGFVAVASRDEVWGIATSTDGVRWSLADLEVGDRRLSDLVHGAGTTLVVGDEAVLSSHDDRVWSWLSRRAGPLDLTQLVSAVETRDALVVFGLVTIPPGAQHRSTAALTSRDGVGWTLQPIWPDPDLDLSAVAWGNDRIVMIGPDECGMSPDGLIWLWCPAPAAAGGATFRGVDWVGDRFVAVGAEGAIAWTVDASSWTAVSPPPTPTSLAAVVAGDGVVVAVGEDGSGVTTADWTTWQPWSTATESWLLDVAWGDGVFVAVAADGTVATSTDGSTWHAQRLPGEPPLRNVTWAGHGFVAASNTAAFTSRDGSTWTQDEDSPPLGGPAHVGGLVPWRDGAVAVGGTSVVALEWSSPATIAGRPQAWVVPAAAHAAGLGGTAWRTDVVLSNPGDVPAQLDLAFLERWRDGSKARPVVNTLLPGTTARLGDLVRDTFGADSAGAVVIGSSRPLAVDSRTFNSTIAGTYGQRVPAVEVGRAVGAGERVVLPGLGRNGSRRTNLGAASLSGEEAVVHFEIVRADGSPLGTIDLPLVPFSSGQLHDALAMVTSDPVEAAWAVAWSGSPDTRFVPYASVVDEGTGDPTFVEPTSTLSARAVIPAVAHLAGAAGTFWRSDVALVNAGPAPAALRLDFVRRGQPGTGALPTATVSVSPGSELVLEDVVATLFGLDAAGALVVTVEQGEVAISSRTFTSTAAGGFGQAVPALPTESGVGDGQRAVLVGLAESCDPTIGYRTNLGFVNLSPVDVTVRVEASHGDGSPIGAADLELPPAGVLQHHRFLAGLGTCAVRTAVVVATSETPGASFLAYASVVDNATGDPTFVSAGRLEHASP